MFKERVEKMPDETSIKIRNYLQNKLRLKIENGHLEEKILQILTDIRYIKYQMSVIKLLEWYQIKEENIVLALIQKFQESNQLERIILLKLYKRYPYFHSFEKIRNKWFLDTTVGYLTFYETPFVNMSKFSYVKKLETESLLGTPQQNSYFLSTKGNRVYDVRHQTVYESNCFQEIFTTSKEKETVQKLERKKDNISE